MALREIVVFPDPRLREKSEPVPEVSEDVRQLVEDMQETMYYHEGAGLAAIQIGDPRRVFIADPVLAGQSREDPVLVFINPEILGGEGQQDGDEGCLSFPGIFVPVERPARVKIRAMDLKGETFEMTGEGILARAFLHETEHMDGVLLIDKVGRLKRELIKRKLKRKKSED
ncbi:MAG: peptide deformylase [Polyangia bacterium]|jgi:peptide deformylase|nr:peptide deformylase [Polyangia bacterium]